MNDYFEFTFLAVKPLPLVSALNGSFLLSMIKNVDITTLIMLPSIYFHCPSTSR